MIKKLKKWLFGKRNVKIPYAVYTQLLDFFFNSYIVHYEENPSSYSKWEERYIKSLTSFFTEMNAKMNTPAA